MKRKLRLLLIMLLFIATPVFAASNDLFVADSSVTETEEKSGTTFVAGNDVTTKNKVDGISFVAGNNVDVNSSSDYLITAGNDVKIENASFRDGFIAGSSVEISDSVVERDVYIAASTVRISSTIGRDVRVASGTLVITGTIEGDVEAYCGTIEVKDGAVIKGVLRYDEDTKVTISENAYVNATEKVKLSKKSFLAKLKADFLDGILSFCNMLVLGILLMIFVPKIFEKISNYGKDSILSNLGIGLLSVIVAPILTVLLLLSIVGISTSLIILDLLIVLLFLSRVFASYYLGNILLSKKIKNKYLLFAVSLLLIYILKLIPFVNVVVTIFTVGVGVGLILRIIFKRK